LDSPFNRGRLVSSGHRMGDTALPKLPEIPYPFSHPDFYRGVPFVGPGRHKKTSLVQSVVRIRE
jgi:hypothetical protein